MRDPRATGVVLLRCVALGAVVLAATATALAPSARALLFDHRLLGERIDLMQVYSFFWLAGGFFGIVAAVAVLRAESASTWATLGAVAAWTAGVWVGARWHYLIDSGGLAGSLSGLGGSPLESGARLPLAFLCGAVTAALWCRVSGAPWRETGDAFAAYAAALVAVGRTGCLLAGCCTGRICPAWLSATCLRYPSGTEPFLEQAAAGAIDITSAMSAPLLPLPLYFALAAAATLLLLARLLGRHAPPGRMLLAFALAWPIWKIGLEQLRATPRPPGLMLGIPAVVLLIALAAALWAPRRTIVSCTPES